MERKEREDRRRVEAETEQQHMERHKTERTDDRMEPNERRRSVGLRDEREGEATSSSPSPLLVPSLPPRENVCACVCFLPRQICHAFIRTQRRHVDIPGTGGREGAGRGTCM